MNKEQFNEKYQRLKYRGDKRNEGRYVQILSLFLQGYSDEEIAEKITSVRETVRGYMPQIYKHFGVGDRKELAELCYQYIPDQVNLLAFSHIKPNSNYIERPPIEAQCHREITKTSALIRIKGLKQTGKTYLVEQNLFKIASKNGNHQILLNLNNINTELLRNSSKFIKWFCKNTTRQLKLEDKLNNYWDNDLGANDNCTIYFEDYILQHIDKSIIIALDNLDQILPYQEIVNDFIRLLRYWLDSNQNISQKVKLIVSYSTEIYHSLDINSSPFYNLGGLVVELAEFNLQQVQIISQNLQINLQLNQLEKLITLLGGHPYLINKAFNHLKNNPDVTIEQFRKTAPTQTGIYQTDLLNLLREIRQDSVLLTVTKELINSEQALKIDPILMFKLDNMGLIKKRENQVQIRNQLYRLYLQVNL